MNKKKQPDTQEAAKETFDGNAVENGGGNASDDEISKLKAEIERLKTENKQLKENASALDAEKSRMEKEISEFSEYFPDISLGDVPESVWNKVKEGLPLTAAYALHERKVKLQKQKVEEVNSANGTRSSGSVKNSSDYYYSPDEVRRMSASEVKRNYSHIINSMKHWN